MHPKEEEWRTVEINDHYQVSSHGRVARGGKMLRPNLDASGYPYVCLWRDGKPRSITVHRLVAFAFIGPKPGHGYDVNHVDGCKTNNDETNLEYITHRQNQIHAFSNGLLKPIPSVGTKNGRSKLTEEQVREISSLLGSGSSLASLGRLFQVTPQTIYAIKTGRLWRHVTGVAAA